MGKECHGGALCGCRVLVVEDDFLMADDFSRRLAQAGAEILGPVATLDVATALVDQAPMLHLAVLDINLRGAMVFPFAERLRGDGIPFVFCTGYGDEPIIARFRDVVRYEKPLSHHGFSLMLAELARMFRLRMADARETGPGLPM